MKDHSRKDMFVIGFALFSMFFGAGNVIFPPYLGMSAGPEWILGFACYYLADIGLALVALFSIFRRGGSQELVSPIGRIPSILLMCAIVLCIGPMLAIPRTAAMTYEMSVQPLAHGVSSVLFSVLFFALVFLCTIRENSVVDIVGKVLTPLLVIGLLILIVKGVASPLGEIAPSAQIEGVAADGIKSGYQTMDVLATMLFGVLILRSAEAKGYSDSAEKCRIAVNASLVAGVMLLVVYGGLTYLGATVSSAYDLSVSRSVLVMSIVTGLLGQKGSLLFALVVALACVTTAVGLVSSCADFFSKLVHGKVSYGAFVTAICVFSAVASNVGLEQIVAIAAPVLDLVYPPALVVIGLSFVPGLPDLAYRLATLSALVFSGLTALGSYAGVHIELLNHLPMASLGFGWVLPAVLFGALGVGIEMMRGKAGKSVEAPSCD